MAKQETQNKRILVVLLLISLCLLVPAAAAETYQFVKMWGVNGSGDNQLYAPTGISVDPSGNVYVSDNWLNRIQKFDSQGNFLNKWGINARESKTPSPGEFSSAFAIHIDASGNAYVTDMGAGTTSRIQKFTPNGKFITSWGDYGSGPGQFNFPWETATDSKGNVYVADSGNNRIQKFTASGTYLSSWGSAGSGTGEFNRLLGIAVDPSDNVFVVDAGNNRIQKFTSEGKFLKTMGSYGSGNGQLNSPAGIATDASGNVFVVDTGNYRVQEFSNDGTFLTAWGEKGTNGGQFISPFKVTVDANGVVYVLDYDQYNPDNPPGYVKGTNVKRVQKFAPLQTIAPPSLSYPNLILTSNPTGADVFVDGVAQGITPQFLPGISPGTHTLAVAKIGYLGNYSSVSLSMGQTATVNVNLVPLDTGTGVVSVRSNPPGASIMLDSKSTGKNTPYDFTVAPGTHTVDVTLVGYTTYSKTVNVKSGETVVVTTPWTYTTPDAVVFFNSVPDGATVYIDEVAKGTTPMSLHFKQDTYIVKMTKDGYKDDISSITVTSGDVREVRRALETPGFAGLLALAALVAVVLFARKRG
ncbi:PEGA domain-containing protein [Methanoregula sp.]|uniref:PEGA domain-containing protein n=1 Tax=Methanoregula sp. TaxID=2052170 RepID=UPI0035658167